GQTEGLVGCAGVRECASTSIYHGVELTWLGYTAQVVDSSIGEGESGARSQVSYGAGDEHLSRLCQPADACSHVHRDSSNAQTVNLGLTRVNAAPELEPK